MKLVNLSRGHLYKMPARVREEQKLMPTIWNRPDVRSHLTLGRLSKRSRASQTVYRTTLLNLVRL